ncbi:MAG: hypothetical protein GXO63_03415 [Candidatus Micrarchaeota archaeon]|nr:hypothetical protein [Candidatus Micrarchaeota archaeon]
MKLNVYKQTTQFTCGPSCALMILNYFLNIKLTRENELEFWKETIAIPFRITLPLTLANFLMKNSLEIRIVSKKLKIGVEGCKICFKYEGIPKRLQQHYFEIFDYYYNHLQLKKFKSKNGEWIRKHPKISEVKEKIFLALIDTYPIDKYLGEKEIHAPDWIVVENNRKPKIYSPLYGKAFYVPLEILQKAVDNVEKFFSLPSSLLLIK